MIPSIDFNPVGFEASSDGAGSKITSGNLAFIVEANAGNGIQAINARVIA